MGPKRWRKRFETGKKRVGDFFGSSAPVPPTGRLLATLHVVACLTPPIDDDGLQVSIEILCMRLILIPTTSSTNARFIESLGSEYKSAIDLVQESRRSDSDDEDQEALFAELEAELENADSAALRDGGVKAMQAQLRRFSSLRSVKPCD